MRVYQFRHTGRAHDPGKSGSRFSDKIMRQETRSLYNWDRRPRPWYANTPQVNTPQLPIHLTRMGRGDALPSPRIALASPRRTGKLPQSTGMELRERIAGQPRCHRQCRDRASSIGPRAEPAAAAAIAVFVLSLPTLAGAWFFEYVLKLAPSCPLCLEQRIPYHVIVPFSLLLGIAALARCPAPRKLLLVVFPCRRSRSRPWVQYRAQAHLSRRRRVALVGRAGSIARAR